MSGDNIGLGAATEDAARATEDGKLEAATEELRAAGLLPVAAPDLLARRFAPVEWIVEDLLAARGGASRGFKGDIIAGSKMRKTFFALQLAACVAAGRNFLEGNGFEGYRVPKPRRVLYLNLELREDFTQERMRRIADTLGAPLGNLEIMSPSRPYLLRNRYGTERDGSPKYLEGYEDQFLEYVNGNGFELVVADPQYKLEFPEEDEISTTGMGGILRWRDRVITETGAACLMVHHDPKSGGADRDLTARGSGSGVLGRDYDARLALDAHADGDPEHEVLECGSRVRPSPKLATVVFDTGTFTFSVDPEIVPKRKSPRNTRSTPAERETHNRDAAESGARAIFQELAGEVEARAGREGRDPTPREYLLSCKEFKSRLAIRGNLGDKACNDQYKRLLEAGIIGWQGVLKRDGKGGAALAGATILHGLPVHIEAYRESFDLPPTGSELRGGIKSRTLA